MIKIGNRTVEWSRVGNKLLSCLLNLLEHQEFGGGIRNYLSSSGCWLSGRVVQPPTWINSTIYHQALIHVMKSAEICL